MIHRAVSWLHSPCAVELITLATAAALRADKTEMCITLFTAQNKVQRNITSIIQRDDVATTLTERQSLFTHCTGKQTQAEPASLLSVTL